MAKAPVRKKNKKPFFGILVVVGIVGVAALGYVLTRPAGKPLTVDPNIPPGEAEGYLMGNPNAPVQVIEFGDFECPGCGSFANVTEPDLRTRLINTGTVALRFFDFPLSGHKNSWTAHTSASCAADQGKFWEMHDRMYAGQDEWNGEVTNDPIKVFKRYASEMGLDVVLWEACLVAQPHAARIKANSAEGTRRRIQGTPTFIIGDKMLPWGSPPTYDQFKRYVDSVLTTQAKSDTAKKVVKPPAAKPGDAQKSK